MNMDASVHVENGNEEIILFSNADANKENDQRIKTAEELARLKIWNRNLTILI